MSNWQPIATAPMDGELVLVYEDFVSVAYFDADEDEWYSPGLSGEMYRPTHWMQLPDPPEIKS